MNADLKRVYELIAESQNHLPGYSAQAIRLTKLSEEVGEVTQAYIGYVGANKRKGRSHSRPDIADELCDVIVTAFVALHDWHHDPGHLLDRHVAKLLKRIGEQGS